jgi:Pyruvate/2-oxoacid:ferredoxin oxidoreductase delta subunit
MAIGNRQIGWSQEENLLWEVSRQLDRMNSILCPCPITTTTSTTIVPTTTTTTTTVNPLIFTDYTFFNCGPCGEFCPDPVQFNDVWMTSECINTWPSIGCAIWNNEEGTSPFNDGTYNLGNGDCIVITGGVITDIIL